ncbi:exodeoxyribonuclease V subunit alpha [Terasakiispira papahanaumokuakeensis]|uniref:RecBCD enzyme subunit RecD n=1 Tax=Terasakiispira papahanaumokuakeensis TaxID=197479 RepID=A0A1E2V7N7_9GAMM|nr:exodeoxyribonuclease V subunit alpha [Terasakiispira papahanaumokuakeensis]ODC02984.1 exodeoxyribonuclease V subunit alpha [Terasakiispira papahanaumokuakeensis]
MNRSSCATYATASFLPPFDLASWQAEGAIRALDVALADFISQEVNPDDDPAQHHALWWATLLVSERNGHGHVCLDLAWALAHPEELLSGLRDERAPEAALLIRQQLQQVLATVELAQWQRWLAASPAVAVVDDETGEVDGTTDEVDDALGGEAAGAVNAAGGAPLVLSGSRLYLRRYWQYEEIIRIGIEQRLADPVTLPHVASTLLAGLFSEPEPADSTATIDWQQVACALAARQRFAVMTGGPGTGKTFTVLKLLALVQGLSLLTQGQAAVIRLAAPTGKAAARLNESISQQVGRLQLPEVAGLERSHWLATIPHEVSTLHRLLGARPDSRHFRHHAAAPLPVDWVVVDEASMVDVEMMASLMQALPAQARLILLGDQDQLASVEAGSVLGDLCRDARDGHYTPATCDWLYTMTGIEIPAAYRDVQGRPLHQAITMLRHSRRFAADGGISQLARLVNEGRRLPEAPPVSDRLQAVLALFDEKRTDEKRTDEKRSAQSSADIDCLKVTAASDRLFQRWIVAAYQPYLRAMNELRPPMDAPAQAFDEWALALFERRSRFQLLAALRRGEWGVEGLNELIRQWLHQAGLLSEPWALWYPGRPVLVTANDYALGLMNGDIGVCLALPVDERDGSRVTRLRVAFPDGQGGVRWVLPSRLQATETVFAMTVHKSQGSEFLHTALVLPDRVNPVLTRELIYTGITRAGARFSLIYSRDDVLGAALNQAVVRVSGLRF